MRNIAQIGMYLILATFYFIEAIFLNICMFCIRMAYKLGEFIKNVKT